MAKFAKPATQAGNVIRAIQGTVLRSVGTARNYEQALTRVAEYTRAERLPGGLRDLTPTQAITYLEKRGQSVGQKTLDMERQAIQCMMIHVTGALGEKEKLPVVRSEHVSMTAGPPIYRTRTVPTACVGHTYCLVSMPTVIAGRAT